MLRFSFGTGVPSHYTPSLVASPTENTGESLAMRNKHQEFSLKQNKQTKKKITKPSKSTSNRITGTKKKKGWGNRRKRGKSKRPSPREKQTNENPQTEQKNKDIRQDTQTNLNAAIHGNRPQSEHTTNSKVPSRATATKTVTASSSIPLSLPECCSLRHRPYPHLTAADPRLAAWERARSTGEALTALLF